MKFNGLKLDNPSGTTTPGTWVYAKNILLGKGFDHLTNDKDSEEIYTDLNYNITFSLATPTELILLSKHVSNGSSRITRLRTDIWNDTANQLVLLESIYVDFGETYVEDSITYYRTIQGIYLYNNKGELIIVITDNHVPPLVFNLGTKENPNTITISSLDDVNRYNLFPVFKQTNVSLSKVLNIGNLKTGTYFASLAYEIEEDIYTSFGIISSPIMLTSKNVSGSNNITDGYNNTNAFKSIELTVTGLDQRYTKFCIAIIKDNIGYKTKSINITGTSVSFVISDLATLTTIAVEEIVIKYPTYNTVKSIAFTNDKLRLANLGKINRRNITDIYNKLIPYISVGWVYEDIISPNYYADPLTIFSKRGFKKDDVYALYLTLHTQQGEEYGTYHIPGREAFTGDTNNLTINVPGNVYTDSKFKLANTATSGVQINPLGYWENENELYGNEFGNYSGDKVRHHKMPTTEYLESLLPFNKSTTYFTAVDATFIHSTTGITPVLYQNVIRPNFLGEIITVTAKRIGGLNVIISSTKTKCISTFKQQLLIAVNIDFPECLPSNSTNSLRIFRLKSYLSDGNDKTSEPTIDVINNNTDDFSIVTNIRIELDVNEYFELEWLTQAETTYSDPIINTFAITEYTQPLQEYTLGLKLKIDWTAIQTNDSVFYNELLKYVNSVELKYAQRNQYDSTIIDQGLTVTRRERIMVPYMSGEYPTYNYYLNYYSPDSLKNNINLNSSYLKVLYNKRASIRNSYFSVDADFNSVLEPIAKFIDLFHNITIKTGNELIPLTEIKYLPEFNSATTPSNDHRENCYLLSFTASDGYFTGNDFSIVDLINIKDDCYLDFINKTLVSTGKVIPIGTTLTKLYGGDIFINPSNLIVSPIFDRGLQNIITILCNCKFKSEAISNIAYRYSGANDWEKYYPFDDILKDLKGSFDSTVTTYPNPTVLIKAGDIFFAYSVHSAFAYIWYTANYYKALVDNPGQTAANWSTDRVGKLEATGKANVILYDNIFNSLNNFIQSDIANVNDVLIQSKFKFRIHSSVTQASSSSSLYFRKFLSLDYYEMPNQKGEIVKILAGNRVLYIQHENTLYRALIIDKLVNENVSAYLKSGDIFDRLPEEMYFDNNTYLSCQGIKSSILTPYGYVLIDTIARAIYLINESVIDLTALGIKDWFNTKLKDITFLSSDVSSIYSNPCLGYDREHDRLFINIIPSNLTENFILSYNFEAKCWVSFHSNKYNDATINNIFYYNYIWNSKGIYGITAQRSIEKLNRFNYIGLDKSVVDMIFSNREGDKFLTESIAFSTEVSELDDSSVYWDETITKVMIYNNQQTSEEIQLTIQKITDSINGLVQSGNLRYDNGIFHFNEFKDKLITPKTKFLDYNFELIPASISNLKQWFEYNPFIDNYVIIRLIFSNPDANLVTSNPQSSKKFKIHSVSIQAKQII